MAPFTNKHSFKNYNKITHNEAENLKFAPKTCNYEKGANISPCSILSGIHAYESNLSK